MAGADPERHARARAIRGPTWDPTRAGVRLARPQLGTFRIGTVLSRSLSIYGRNVLPFVVISLVVHLPLFAYLTYGGEFYRPSEDERPDIGRLFTSLQMVSAYAQIGLALIVSGPLTYGVFEQLRGRRPSLPACVRAGLRSVPRVLGVGLILLFMVVGLLVGLFFAIVVLALLGLGPRNLLFEWGVVVGTAFAFGAFFCRHAVAVPAAVVERTSPGIALFRSRVLTRANAWRVFGLGFLVYLMSFGVSIVLTLATGGTLGPRPRFALLVDAIVGASLWVPLLAVALAVCYHDLRVSAEGVDTEELARVFE